MTPISLLLASLCARDGGKCATAMECSLNGDCIDGVCSCDPMWTGSPECSVVAFEPLAAASGYANATYSSWGGLPIKDPSTGKYHLFHAQFVNHCPLGSWTKNSIVARAAADRLEGPYAFEAEVLPHFAHNPTIRALPGGGYAIYYIGGWATNASHCSADDVAAAERPWAAARGACAASAKLDPPSRIRVGGDYKDVELSRGSEVSVCIAACCNDPKCRAFSFNRAANRSAVAPGCSTAKGAACCKLKSTAHPTIPSGCHSCTTGVVSKPKPPPCGGEAWPKPECPEKMPGPSHDTCGAGLNEGCGIAVAHSQSLTAGRDGWTTVPLIIEDQWRSPRLYVPPLSQNIGETQRACLGWSGSVLSLFFFSRAHTRSATPQRPRKVLCPHQPFAIHLTERNRGDGV